MILPIRVVMIFWGCSVFLCIFFLLPIISLADPLVADNNIPTPRQFPHALPLEQRPLDSDMYAMPIQSSLIDLLGQCLLLSTFELASALLGDKERLVLKPPATLTPSAGALL
jgi:hypothetical protein